MRVVVLMLFCLLCIEFRGQVVNGLILNNQNNRRPIEGAIVYWKHSDVATETDSLGRFSLKTLDKYDTLTVVWDTLKIDTLILDKNQPIQIVLNLDLLVLDNITIEGSQSSIVVDTRSAFNTHKMTSLELGKAACCNLSESFETNPSVDVSYSDALTGAKSIQMLGLAGKYTYLSFENLPLIRGLAISNGLGFIPGPWLQSIQVTKGVGAVTSSFEGIGGDINIELKKPDEKEKFYFNSYLNEMGRTEFNLNHKISISSKWSQLGLYHFDFMPIKNDLNGDGYLNIPIGRQINFLNRWKYKGENGLIAQFGLHVVNDNKIGGSKRFDAKAIGDSTKPYGILLDTKRFELFGKVGYVFPQKPFRSLGVLLKSYLHRQFDVFGLNKYVGVEDFISMQMIYQSILFNSKHKFRLGGVGFANKYDETVFFNNFKRNEYSFGSFGEYSFSSLLIKANLGVRIDYHNLMGIMVNPRVHFRVGLSNNMNLRLSGGRGQRISNVFAENNRFLFGNRVWKIEGMQNSTGAYGLNKEDAWNLGLSLSKEWSIGKKDGTFVIDLFHTKFNSQVVVDLDNSINGIMFYNLSGKSFSNNLQLELNQVLVKGFELRVAYRFVDAQTSYLNGQLSNPFISKHRFFANIAIASRNRKWKYDYTINLVGAKRVPILLYENKIEYGIDKYSPSYLIHNAQITRILNKKLELYLGVENMTNYMQKVVIINPDRPYGSGFDTGMVWGPTIGRMTYLGLRYVVR